MRSRASQHSCCRLPTCPHQSIRRPATRAAGRTTLGNTSPETKGSPLSSSKRDGASPPNKEGDAGGPRSGRLKEGCWASVPRAVSPVEATGRILVDHDGASSESRSYFELRAPPRFVWIGASPTTNRNQSGVSSTSSRCSVPWMCRIGRKSAPSACEITLTRCPSRALRASMSSSKVTRQA